jgi:hypothetical protein
MLLNDNTMAGKLGESGKKRVIEKFSARAQLDSTIGLYRSILIDR